MAVLFDNSLLLFGSSGTTVHLPVFPSHIYSMGKLSIFCLYPPHPLFSLGLICSATAKLHCRATAPAVTPAAPTEELVPQWALAL